MPEPAVAGGDADSSGGGGGGGFLQAASEEIVVVTHCFDPAGFGPGAPGAVTVRFSGRRRGVDGRPGSGDRFVHDEVVDALGAGDGPISVTARVGGVNPGSWEVHAQAFCGRRHQAAPRVGRCRPWRGPQAGADEAVTTCVKPLAKIPGLVRFGWLAAAVLGMALGVAVQAVVAAGEGTTAGSVWPVSLVGLAGGVIGAKAWFVVKHRGERRAEGWCVQGLVVGFAAAALAGLALTGTSLPRYFDPAAPGLFLGLAVGRAGCVGAGCCYGRPTASRWGLWLSDQRVVRKRIPTQLVELALLVAVGVGALAADLVVGPQGGAIFVASVAAYVLGRQPILALRGEPTRWARVASPVAALAGMALAADVACAAVACLA